MESSNTADFQPSDDDRKVLERKAYEVVTASARYWANLADLTRRRKAGDSGPTVTAEEFRSEFLGGSEKEN